MSSSENLIEAAKRLAEERPGFQTVLGPGAGDRATAAYLLELQKAVQVPGEASCHERRICGATGFAVDFYFEEEKTIVEVALGLPNPQSEFEKDVLKAVIAKESGVQVDRLVFVSRAGGAKKCSQPGRTAVIAWARERHGIDIEVHDLPGEPRKRIRARV